MGFSRFFWKPWSYTQSIDKSITVIWYIRRITNEEMCCWKIIPLENVSIVDAWTAHRYVSSILATLKEKLFLQRTPPNHCFWQKTDEKLKREFIVRKNIFQTINVRDDVMWTIFLYFYSYWAITREKKISLFILQLFTLILQSTVVGTQTAIYVELCPVRSSSDSSSSLIHFFSHEMLTILHPRKLNDGSVTLWDDMAWSFAPLCQSQYVDAYYTFLAQVFDWYRYPYFRSTFTSRVLGIFPVMPLMENWWRLLRKNVVDIFNNRNIRF